MTINRKDLLTTSDPCVLVSILIAARRAGFRTAEEVARRTLHEQYGVKLTFAREKREVALGL